MYIPTNEITLYFVGEYLIFYTMKGMKSKGDMHEC